MVEFKITNLDVEIPIYFGKLCFYIGKREDKLHELFNLIDYETKILRTATSLKINIDNTRGFLIAISDDSLAYNILSHEIFHITAMIMEYAGCSLDISSEEAYAYLNGWISEQIYSYLNNECYNISNFIKNK